MADSNPSLSFGQIDLLKSSGVVALVTALVTLAPVVQFLVGIFLGELFGETGFWNDPSAFVGYVVALAPASILNATVAGAVVVRLYKPQKGLLVGVFTGILTCGLLYYINPIFMT